MSLFQSGSSSRQIFKSALRFINFAAKFGNLQFKHESLRYFHPQWITIWDGAILLMHVYLLFLILGIRNCPNELEFTRKFLKIVEKTVKNNKWKSLPFRSLKKNVSTTSFLLYIVTGRVLLNLGSHCILLSHTD